MSQIHYFQRFSQQENVDTNNTLLLLSRIQATDQRLIRGVLANLFTDADAESGALDVGVQFSQQYAASQATVPDGMLYQTSFRIVMETKRQPHFDADQLKGHLDSFGNEQTKILLLLAPERVHVHVPDAAIKNVTVCSRSFADVIAACRTAGVGEDLGLRDILDDFTDYCLTSKLMPEDDLLLVVPVGDTVEENLSLKLYYAPVWYHSRQPRYIGFYSQKVVRYVAVVHRAVRVDRTSDGLSVLEPNIDLSADEELRIIAAMEQAPSHGWDIETGRRFFLVTDFKETAYRKVSSGGMMRGRYFSLRTQLGLPSGQELPDIETIAHELRIRTWE